MSDDQNIRVRDLLKSLEGVDAKQHIEGMRDELKRTIQEGRQRAQFEREAKPQKLKVDVMAFEKADGSWKIETLGDCFPGQNGAFSATDDTEGLAMADFRFVLMQELAKCRYARQEEARQLAMRADINVCGRVPYLRIVSK